MSLLSTIPHFFDSHFPFLHLHNTDIHSTTLFVPRLDIKETENSIFVQLDLPGMKKNDIKIAFENNLLTIHGERKNDSKKDEDQFHSSERSFGSFSRTIRLPEGIDSNVIKAKYDNGVLCIEIPKPEQYKKMKPVDIHIQSSL